MTAKLEWGVNCVNLLIIIAEEIQQHSEVVVFFFDESRYSLLIQTSPVH